MSSKPTTKIYIVYYSMYGHVAQLAKKEAEGVNSVPGCEAVLLQVKETLPPEVTEKMHAPPQDENIPFVNASQLEDGDGFIFGFPTRFGNVAGQFKSFWDSTGQLWMKGSLAAKPYSTFTSTATQHGGQEVTHFTALTNFVHHGMIHVPIGSSFGAEMANVTDLRGGSCWGASTHSGSDGSKQPSKVELDFAFHQGQYCAKIYQRFAGKA